jgi:ribonucleoside-diphosphate reductase alpha chain
VSFKSQVNPSFKSPLSETIFNEKYRHDGCETWEDLCSTLVDDVMLETQGANREDKEQLKEYMYELKFIPGGRYLRNAGRPIKFFNNCFLLRAEEDTREDWANLSWKSESCLITGGGIGIDYSRYRGEGSTIKRTGGVASGAVSAARKINGIGHEVMQGGGRRSAIYGSLNWQHDDIPKWLTAKNWHQIQVTPELTLWDIKSLNRDFPAPLDMTNISVNYDTKWLLNVLSGQPMDDVFLSNVKQALSTGDPGFSFNFFEKEEETLRNACTEVSSADDSDVCNLGSINLARINSITELVDVVSLAIKFLLHGTLRADLPYDKVRLVREKNRRLGLGLMGIHEWLLRKDYRYEVVPELHQWLTIYKGVSDAISKNYSNKLSVSVPVANRAIAPTGTIGMLAGTTTGIEPVYAVAYKRRYLVEGKRWKYQYNIDSVAKDLVNEGISPDTIESAIDLAKDYERRIKFQADIQDYVDHGISSTINLPAWGSDLNNDDTVIPFSNVLASYASRLRGFTCYPDGARGGQPLTSVDYDYAVDKLGEEFDDAIQFNDVCSITEKGGSCGS